MSFLKDFQRAVRSIYRSDAPLILDQLTSHATTPQTKASLAWHRELILYVTYADGFRTRGAGDFTTLQRALPSIQSLGCTAVHVLPFLASPMADFGFDISDYTRVRADVGGDPAFRAFLRDAKKRELRVFMDLVLNHCSVEHKWFREASRGNNRYRDFFCVTDTEPTLLRRFTNRVGSWATYDINGKKVPIYIVFPAQAGENPHWEKLQENSLDGSWYYHTFYPQQPDLNWQNPEVFLEFCKIIAKWTGLGLNFRLDAIGFIGKDLRAGVWMDEARTHAIVNSLNNWIKSHNPEAALLSEVVAPTKAVVPYFGTKRNPESDLAYNFELMQATWTALTDGKATKLWAVLKRSGYSLPRWGNWVTFLRNHDELSLEFMPSAPRHALLKALVPHGLEFKNGFGITGRTASLLGSDPARLLLAYSLLLAMPGAPAIMYGDEYGKSNDPAEMKRQIAIKRRRGMKDVVEDARDINRGGISAGEIKHGAATFDGLKALIQVRRTYSGFFATPPRNRSRFSDLMIVEYTLKRKTLTIACNLGRVTRRLSLTNSCAIIASTGELGRSPKGDCSLTPNSSVWILSKK